MIILEQCQYCYAIISSTTKLNDIRFQYSRSRLCLNCDTPFPDSDDIVYDLCERCGVMTVSPKFNQSPYCLNCFNISPPTPLRSS